MPIILPIGLARLADFAQSRDSTARFTCNGIHAETLDTEPDSEGKPTKPAFRLTVTDTKRLAVYYPPVGDPSVSDGQAARIAAAPNGAKSAIIPIDSWKELTGTKVKTPTGIVLGEPGTGQNSPTVTIVGANSTATVDGIEGRFPPFEQFIPRQKPEFAAAFCPRLMGESLLAISKMGGIRAVMSFVGEDKPCIIRSVLTNGAECIRKDEADRYGRIEAIVMPMGCKERDGTKVYDVPETRMAANLKAVQERLDELAKFSRSKHGEDTVPEGFTNLLARLGDTLPEPTDEAKRITEFESAMEEFEAEVTRQDAELCRLGRENAELREQLTEAERKLWNQPAPQSEPTAPRTAPNRISIGATIRKATVA